MGSLKIMQVGVDIIKEIQTTKYQNPEYLPKS
jgi:hypothetical protein